MKNRRASAIVIGILALAASGCHGRCLTPPGPMDFQQSRAVVNDPFPLDDIGPSDATTRPPGFEQPLPQPVRDRIVKDSMPWALAQ